MKKYTVIAIILLFCINLSFGQEKEKKLKRNMCGINMGATTGIGFSYKHWKDVFGVQITGLPIKVDDDFDFSIGLTFFSTIKQRKHFNIFAYAGANYMSSNFRFIFDMNPIYSFTNLNREQEYYYNEETHQSNYNANYFNTSIGAGVEIGKNPIVTIMAGYAALDLTESFSLLPTIEVGLHFKI